jgi:hypothetical protein
VTAVSKAVEQGGSHLWERLINDFGFAGIAA